MIIYVVTEKGKKSPATVDIDDLHHGAAAFFSKIDAEGWIDDQGDDYECFFEIRKVTY